ncbi:hypothetical protein GCM10010169_33050 [Micromonospora fulviviridis]|nr:hypothetical protein GCM10010169_33050 [Micromonospora fulviviridis]
MKASRISARPATPNAAQATAVKTTAAVPSSSPPRTKSRLCTARVEVSAPPGRTGAGAGCGRAGGTVAAGATGRGAGISRRMRAASSARRCRAVDSRPASSWYATRASSTRGVSPAISRSSRTTSAAGGYGGRPQPGQPEARSAGAPQPGQG